MTRLAIIVYDSLLLFGVLFVAGLLFDLIVGYRGGALRIWFQLYCLVIVATYFVWFWQRHGQTLAMRAWHVRLVTARGTRLTWPQAALRLALAAAGWGLFGVTLWWSFFDRDRQYLHDRLSGTKLTQS